MGSEKNYKLNLNENSLFDPLIIFITDNWHSPDNAAIVWEYEKNTIYVGTGNRKNEKGTRYFLDKRNAKVLYDLYMKYDCRGIADAM